MMHKEKRLYIEILLNDLLSIIIKEWCAAANMQTQVDTSNISCLSNRHYCVC